MNISLIKFFFEKSSDSVSSMIKDVKIKFMFFFFFIIWFDEEKNEQIEIIDLLRVNNRVTREEKQVIL